jgi:HEAT repeat protein
MEAELELVSCPVNPQQHVYHRSQANCPWCALSRGRGRDFFPSREDVEAGRVGARAAAPAEAVQVGLAAASLPQTGPRPHSAAVATAPALAAPATAVAQDSAPQWQRRADLEAEPILAEVSGPGDAEAVPVPQEAPGARGLAALRQRLRRVRWPWLVGAGAAALLLVVVLVVVRFKPSRQGPPADPGTAPSKASQPPVPKPRPERKPITDPNLKRLVENLKSPDGNTRKGAADQLAGMIPVDGREEVAEALEPLLDVQDIWTRVSAVSALSVWASEENVPILVRALAKIRGDFHVFVRVGAQLVKALSQTGDERAAEAIAGCLGDFWLKDEPRTALERMGPAAEPALIKLLGEGDAAKRVTACDILKVVGTKRSLPALETASKDSNAQLAQAARDAIRIIKERASK